MKKNIAETEVRKFLKKQGFTLSNQRDERSGGVDVVAIKDGEVLLIYLSPIPDSQLPILDTLIPDSKLQIGRAHV